MGRLSTVKVISGAEMHRGTPPGPDGLPRMPVGKGAMLVTLPPLGQVVMLRSAAHQYRSLQCILSMPGPSQFLAARDHSMLHPSSIASEPPRKRDESLDRIHLNGLLFHGFHGVIPEVS